MIYYVVSAGEAGPFDLFVRAYAPSLAGQIRTLPYWRLATQGSLLPGTYIFSQIELLPPDLSAAVGEICDGLENRPGFRVLNHPRKALRRYDLLAKLHAEGLNEFRVHRLDHGGTPKCFPVFIRGENDHRGSQTVLLRNIEEFRMAAAAFRPDKIRPEKDIVVEFCDTADAQGVYRKYSVVIVGDRIVPRHLFFGRQWMIKYVDKVVSPPTLEEEKQFVDGNPHEAQTRRIFELAGIQYGRIDYSMLNGRIQTWEINTHPRLIEPTDYTEHPERAYVQDRFRECAVAAFDALDTQTDGDPYRIGAARMWKLARSVLAARLKRKLYVLERRGLQKRLKTAGL